VEGYTISMLIFSMVTMLVTYAILRLQGMLPLNPQGFSGVPDHLAFNAAMSFTTNTNCKATAANRPCRIYRRWLRWPARITFLPLWVSQLRRACAGIARDTAATVGNFWVDLVRITYYLLLPICVVFSIFLVSQGMIQNFKGYDTATLTEKETIQVPKNDANGNPVKDAQGNPVMVPQDVTTQSIPEGRCVADGHQDVGTNGGGYTNANAAHPFENPTPFSNFIQMLSIFAIPSALTYYLGRMVKSPGHGWSVWVRCASCSSRAFSSAALRSGGQSDSDPARRRSRRW